MGVHTYQLAMNHMGDLVRSDHDDDDALHHEPSSSTAQVPANYKLDFAPSDSPGDPAARDCAHSPLRAPEGDVLLRDLGRRRLAGDGGLEGQRLGHQCEDAGETTQNISAQRSRTKRFL